MEPSAQLEVNHLRNKSNWWWSSMKSLAGLKIPSSNKILLGLKRALFHTKVQFSNESRHPKRMNCCRVSMGTVDCRERHKASAVNVADAEPQIQMEPIQPALSKGTSGHLGEKRRKFTSVVQ